MSTLKYVIKRVLLMLLTAFIILSMCFVLIKLLPFTIEAKNADEYKYWEEYWTARGYIIGKQPSMNLIMDQYVEYIKDIVTRWDWGVCYRVDTANTPVTQTLFSRIAPTVILNVYSLLFSVPVGILLGIYAALKKNKWQDDVISTGVMIFVSVPSYVYAFLLQLIFYAKLKWLNTPTVLSFREVTEKLGVEAGSMSELSMWFSWPMFVSMILPILSLSFGVIAGLARYTRAELTEVLTSDFMLLARAKGLTKRQATWRHAMPNAMVPILPMIIGEFASVLSGSFIIESIFRVPGVGALYINSINQYDYNLFLFLSMFYTVIGLGAGIIIDLSYGFIDPRIRMGEK